MTQPQGSVITNGWLLPRYIASLAAAGLVYQIVSIVVRPLPTG
jgi:molybdenum cofactor biosynthesis enzyme MoaA